MHKSILLELIGALEKEDLNELHKFVCSPFFNRSSNSEKIVNLFEYIRTYYPDLENLFLGKEATYLHLFPEQKFIKSKLDKLMSSLLNLVKEFIAYKYSGLQNEKKKQLLALGLFYKEKKLDKRFKSVVNQFYKQSETAASDIKFYQYQFLNHQLISEYSSWSNKRKGDNSNLRQTLKSLDTYYIVYKLQFVNALMIQNQFSADSNINNLPLLPDILNLIQEETYNNVPLIQLYYHIYFMLQEPKIETHYQNFKRSLNQHIKSFSPRVQKQFQFYAVNYCVLQYNKGNTIYLEEIFNLYKCYLASGSLYYNEKLRPSTFKNIVHFGLKLRKFEWVKNFLDTHQFRITKTKSPRDVFQFNMAVYYFYLKKYEKSINLLSDTYEDFYYNLASRRLEIKIYYETDSPILESRMDAFKAFLFRRSKQVLSSEQTNLNNNFIDLLRQINHPKTLHNRTRINKILDKIRKTTQVTEKSWLIEKVSALY